MAQAFPQPVFDHAPTVRRSWRSAEATAVRLAADGGLDAGLDERREEALEAASRHAGSRDEVELADGGREGAPCSRWSVTCSRSADCEPCICMAAVRGAVGKGELRSTGAGRRKGSVRSAGRVAERRRACANSSACQTMITWGPALVSMRATWGPALVSMRATWGPGLVSMRATWGPALVSVRVTWGPGLVGSIVAWNRR